MASATDNFNRANETPIASPWTRLTGGSGNLNLSSNAVQSSATGDKFYYYSGSATTADQYSEIKMTSAVTETDFGPAVRVGAGSNMTAYWAACWSTTPQIGKVVNNTFTTVKTVSTSVTTNDVIRCEAEGTTIRWMKNGAIIDSATDSSITTTGGGAGLFVFQTGGALDDWAGGDYSPITYQYARPDADNATGSWTRGGTDSGSLFGQLDETSANDGDYITATAT